MILIAFRLEVFLKCSRAWTLNRWCLIVKSNQCGLSTGTLCNYCMFLMFMVCVMVKQKLPISPQLLCFKWWHFMSCSYWQTICSWTKHLPNLGYLIAQTEAWKWASNQAFCKSLLQPCET